MDWFVKMDLEHFEQFGLRELWIVIQLILIWIIFSHCRSRANRGFKRKLAVDLAATCHGSIRLQPIMDLTIWFLLGFMCSSSIRLTFSAHTADSSWIHLLYGRSLIVVETLAQVYLHFCKMVQDSTDICNMVYLRWTQSRKFKNRHIQTAHLPWPAWHCYLPTHD